MIGLTIVEVYNPISNTTVENNTSEVYTDLLDNFSFTDLRDEMWTFLIFQLLQRKIYKEQ